MTAAPVNTSGSPPEPVDRRRRRTARTRASIEAAALRLFTEQGFATTTVEQIAEAADIAPRTFFRHFPSKDAVLFPDPVREVEHLRAALDERPSDEHPMRSFAAAMLVTADRMEPDREQHILRAQLLNGLEATGEYEFHLFRQRFDQNVTELFAERLGTSACDDPRAHTWSMVLLSCFASAMHTWLTRTDGVELRRTLADILNKTVAVLGEAADEAASSRCTTGSGAGRTGLTAQ